MDTSPCTCLELCAPLIYVKHPEPAVLGHGQNSGENKNHQTTEYCSGGEQLFCFELEPENSTSIEPERGHFLGPMLFSAYQPESDTGSLPFGNEKKAELLTVPAGVYLFTQKREKIDKEACIDMAIEQQKDGLWERYKLKNILYIRFLHEDGAQVTQILRPVEV